MIDASKKYVKKSHIEHILDRPDTYVGSIEPVTETLYVINNTNDCMIKEDIQYTPGLFKIFDEILCNAYDQSILDDTLEVIKVSVDESTNSISVFNDGQGIPVQKHTETDLYIPEMIFGHLLTSSNYDDTQERIVGGRNGYGAKLTNIFSKVFDLDIQDRTSGLVYTQQFTENMSKIGKPKIKTAPSSKLGKGHVKISFSPDLIRFGCPNGLTQGMLKLIQRRVYDIAACVNSKVSVYWQGKKVQIKTFERYVDMFLGDKKVPRVFQKFGDRWEVAVAYSPTGFQHWSFVNGIATYKGGTHITHVANQLIEKMKATNKKAATVRPADIRERLWLFVRCTLVNPAFSSQTKEECTTKVSSWGSKVELTDDFVKKVIKLGILDTAIEESASRDLAKTDGKKRSTLRIPKLEDANKAGTSESNLCTLILTEGDSAKTFAISGMQVTGRDYWGVFPLKGKLLNVRDASVKQVAENTEITHLKQILGLQHGKEYQDVSSLRYGRVMILSDSDVDGLHIKGLVLNLFHCYWPSLLKAGFIVTMATPIVKAFPSSRHSGLNVESFFTLAAYKSWKEQVPNIQAYRIKYYKGLGTSTSQEAKEIFAGVTDNTVSFSFDDDSTSDAALELAFKKTLTHQRKTWIQDTLSTPSIMEREMPNSGKVDVSAFINSQLVQFSIADIIRSLPSMCDGLKPSQRKVVFACLRRNIQTEMRVSQLASAVGEMTSYHHGDASLCATVINMAQNFVGSNNINLLRPVGQFGTRLQGGKDAASPRYIFTHLERITKMIFDSADNALLEYLNDDGTPIEPKYFMPIIPLVLVNGAEGIGTGYSTSIPPHNPIDIINNIYAFLDGKELQPMMPWYKGFKGSVSQFGETSFRVEGKANWSGPRQIEVTELPVGVWTSDFKEMLDSDKSPVDSYENYCTDTTVRFILKLNPDQVQEAKADLLKFLGLVKHIHISNMHLFDGFGKVQKYNSTTDILKEFCTLRIEYYEKRRLHIISELTQELSTLTDKMKFIQLVMSGDLVIFKRPQADIQQDMEELKLSIDLIKTPVSDFTQDKVDSLQSKIIQTNSLISDYQNTTAPTMWRKDLQKLFDELATEQDDPSTSDTADLPLAKRIRKIKRTKHQEN